MWGATLPVPQSRTRDAPLHSSHLSPPLLDPRAVAGMAVTTRSRPLPASSLLGLQLSLCPPPHMKSRSSPDDTGSTQSHGAAQAHLQGGFLEEVRPGWGELVSFGPKACSRHCGSSQEPHGPGWKPGPLPGGERCSEGLVRFPSSTSQQGSCQACRELGLCPHAGALVGFKEDPTEK